MVEFGYFASLEQWSPTDCLEYVQMAEEAGFESIWVNDHFHPFFHTLEDGSLAHGGNCWSWLAAALERTGSIDVGTGVTALLYRHHPATIAHRLATLMEIYPGRVFLGVGTGHALNESPIGGQWPGFSERLGRTAEGIRIVRRLFEETFLDFDGEFWSLDGANLYSGPDAPPPIHVAANGETSARMAGDLGDGLLTAPAEPDSIAETVFPAVEAGLETSDDQDATLADFQKTVILTCSYADSMDRAVEACRKWGVHLLPLVYDYDVSDPRYLQRHAEKIGREQLTEEFVVTTDAGDIVDAVETYARIGFDRVLVLSASPDQTAFCEMMAGDVIPAFE